MSAVMEVWRSDSGLWWWSVRPSVADLHVNMSGTFIYGWAESRKEAKRAARMALVEAETSGWQLIRKVDVS